MKEKTTTLLKDHRLLLLNLWKRK